MVRSEREHEFDVIHVVEYLRKGDRRTGRELMREVIEKQTAMRYELQAHLHEPATKEDFLDTLTEITEQCRVRNHSPILHLETHAAAYGIGLSETEVITWPELKDILTKLNIVSEMNLFVVLAACDGQHLVKVVSPVSRAPLWGLIGPKRTLNDIELLCGFEAFYKELLVSLNGAAAIRAMNSVTPLEPDLFRFFSAEAIFCEVFNKYHDTHCSPEALKQREEAIISELRRCGSLSEVKEKGLRAQIQKKLGQPETHFRKMKRHFFLLDLYPGNTSRFPISYDDCVRKGDSCGV